MQGGFAPVEQEKARTRRALFCVDCDHSELRRLAAAPTTARRAIVRTSVSGSGTGATTLIDPLAAA